MGRIVNEYEVSKLNYHCPYKTLPAYAVALETAQLVYMQESRGSCGCLREFHRNSKGKCR